MNRSERIHIPAKRGQLPRRYRRLGLDRPSYNWWHVSLAVLGCVALLVVVYLVLR